MVTVLSPAGPWQQLASASFFLSALASDLLLLRLFLFAAYTFLFTAALTGYPKFPQWGWQDIISVDGIVWASVVLVFHGYALWRHLWDERPIRFKSEDEEQLWRFFYRRSGMERLEMKECLKRGRWRTYEPGETIMDARNVLGSLHLLVEGLVSIRRLDPDSLLVLDAPPQDGVEAGALRSPPSPTPKTDAAGSEGSATKPGSHGSSGVLHSGCLFDLGVANVFGVFIGFEPSADKIFAAKAKTRCLVYEWRVEELDNLVRKGSPSVTAYWRNFLLCQIGAEFEARIHRNPRVIASSGELEGPELWHGARSRDFTEALSEGERSTKFSWRTALNWLIAGFKPLPPAGLRHFGSPHSGTLARNRLIALRSAHVWASVAAQAHAGEESGLLNKSPAATGTTEASTASDADIALGIAAARGVAGLRHRDNSIRMLRTATPEELLEHVNGRTPEGDDAV